MMVLVPCLMCWWYQMIAKNDVESHAKPNMGDTWRVGVG